MAVDKKVSELDPSPGLAITDLFLSVKNDTDYKFTGTQLIAFVNSLITAGAVVTFSETIPANTSGKNGDVVIKPSTGGFYQRVAGVWILQYTPAAGTGTTVLYGNSTPNSATGVNGDTFIKTDGGIFYKKTAGAWVQVFSMATGPAGATGAAGAAGANGTNGKSVLNGTTPPSNVSTGTDGDFYINTSTLLIYGPKAGGIWPAGVSLINNAPSLKVSYPVTLSDSRFTYDATAFTLTFALNSDDKILFPFNPVYGILDAGLRLKIDSDGFVFKTQKTIEAIITNDGNYYTSVLFEGIVDITNLYLILS